MTAVDYTHQLSVCAGTEITPSSRCNLSLCAHVGPLRMNRYVQLLVLSGFVFRRILGLYAQGVYAHIRFVS